MAGLFPSIANSQNVDRNGQPLASAQLTVYTGGTLALAATYQDIGLAIPAQNPMLADQTGRLPLFYVADGVYRVRLIDQFGTLIYDYAQVASIGASATGGGGGAVDPTTVASVGDYKWRPTADILTGWVRANGNTIGNAVSGASERASPDTQALFIYLWNLGATPIGGRGASGLADFNANKAMPLTDMRGFAPHGLDTMGAPAANRLVGALFGPPYNGNSSTPGSTGGEATHTLTAPEIPAHTHSGTTGTESATHTHAQQNNTGLNQLGGTAQMVGSAGNLVGGTTGTESATHTHPFTTDNGTGGGGAHNNMDPFILGTWYIKL